MKTHTAAIKMECSKCIAEFSTKWNFHDDSMRDGADKFPCEQCEISFCTETLYKKHMGVEHDCGIGKFNCERCIMYFIMCSWPGSL